MNATKTKRGIRGASGEEAHRLLDRWSLVREQLQELEMDLRAAVEDVEPGEWSPEQQMPLERLGAVLMLVESLRSDIPQLTEWLDSIENGAASLYHEQRYQRTREAVVSSGRS